MRKFEYIWKIEIILKNGKQFEGVYHSRHNNSADVATKLFKGNPCTFRSIGSEDGTKELYFEIGEVAAFFVSVAQ